MSNGCSSLFKKKICFDDATNIVIEIKEENDEKKNTKNTNKFYDNISLFDQITYNKNGENIIGEFIFGDKYFLLIIL